MKDIKNYTAEKYEKEGTEVYKRIEEGEFADNISQYPLEDILDEYYCHISDFYEELNVADSKVCYLEFGATDLEDIVNLRGIIEKHVYNAEYEKDGQTYIKLVIE